MRSYNSMRQLIIFNIRFIDSSLYNIIQEINKGGIMIAPSAPSLVMMNNNPIYVESMEKSNFAIFDSSYLCLLLFFIKGIKVNKTSGLKFIKYFLEKSKGFDHNSIFLIDPNKVESDRNRNLFISYGYLMEKKYQYIAPKYSNIPIIDNDLFRQLNSLKPKYIIINLGGGIQEIIAYKIKNKMEYNPSIICTGAAISFLTGAQVKIPGFIDSIGLGWFYRCVFNFRVFIPRYYAAFKLASMLFSENIIIKNYE